MFSMKNKPQSGFTLIELIVTIIVAGILAATVLPRWDGSSGFEDRGFREDLISALRFAQKTAVGARRTVCVTFSSSPAQAAAVFRVSVASGAVDCSLANGNDLLMPFRRSHDVLPNQVLASRSGLSFTSAPDSITFDSEGKANCLSGLPPAAFSPCVISISGLPNTMDISVETGTGYVH